MNFNNANEVEQLMQAADAKPQRDLTTVLENGPRDAKPSLNINEDPKLQESIDAHPEGQNESKLTSRDSKDEGQEDRRNSEHTHYHEFLHPNLNKGDKKTEEEGEDEEKKEKHKFV